MGSATLVAITVYPIKAFDGIAVERADLTTIGGLVGDRQFAIVDKQGCFVNGKRFPMINQLRAKFDRDLQSVTLAVNGLDGDETFALEPNNPKLIGWLGDALGMPVRLDANREHGFPDSAASPGPTLLSRATLLELTAWFPHIDLGEIRRRFRANLEIDDVESFWEDRLVENSFQIGAVSLHATKHCPRCSVPTQHPDTGEVDLEFQREFESRRRESLPPGVSPYVLAINTRLEPGSGTVLQTGEHLIFDDP